MALVGLEGSALKAIRQAIVRKRTLSAVFSESSSLFWQAFIFLI
jgi:hypothetical protein